VVSKEFQLAASARLEWPFSMSEMSRLTRTGQNCISGSDLWADVGASGGQVRELRELLAKEALAFLHSAENGNGNLSCQ
jgi:hypothetical protein